MEALKFVLLIALAASTSATGFTLVAHREHNCFQHTSRFFCFNVGYNYCCQRPSTNDPQLPIGFLSMSQSSVVDGDLLVVHKKYGSYGCGGSAVGSDIYGCADASIGIAFGGMAHSCSGNCPGPDEKRSEHSLACKGIHEADGVYYEGLAYNAHSTDPRMKVLLAKIDDDEVLSKGEIQEMEAIRMPDFDIHKIRPGNGTEGSK